MNEKRAVKRISMSQSKGNRVSLNMNKAQILRILLKWNCDDDLDASALMGQDDGEGPKIYDITEVLTTFNVIRKDGREEVGCFKRKPDGSFETPCGGIHHSGDALQGNSDDDADEIITINTGNLPDYINSIPIFVSIYDRKNPLKKLQNLKGAEIIITNDDVNDVIISYMIEGNYEDFNVLQFGPIELKDNGWVFVENIKGFKNTLAEVVDTFWAE